MYFYGWFPNSWSFLSRKKCIGAMFSYLRKVKNKLLREVYLLARCLMLNWSRRYALIHAKNTWNLWVFFLQFFESFRGKYIKNILQERKNGLSLRQEHFISSLADKTNAPRKNEQYFYVSSPLEDTDIFPKLLFWSDSWITAPVSHNRFFITNLYIWWQ